MQPRIFGPNLYTSKPPDVYVLENMTNVRVCSVLIKANVSQWQNVVVCKNLGLKCDDQQLRASIGLRLGHIICDPQVGYFEIGFLFYQKVLSKTHQTD